MQERNGAIVSNSRKRCSICSGNMYLIPMCNTMNLTSAQVAQTDQRAMIPMYGLGCDKMICSWELL